MQKQIGVVEYRMGNQTGEREVMTAIAELVSGGF